VDVAQRQCSQPAVDLVEVSQPTSTPIGEVSAALTDAIEYGFGGLYDGNKSTSKVIAASWI